LPAGVVAELVLIRFGQTYGSIREERAMRLLGDDIVPNPIVVTNHALDWSWALVLLPLEDGPRTRFLFRSRWVTSPWWFRLAG
jgi:hypothetical protein